MSRLAEALQIAQATAARMRPVGWDLEPGDVLSAAYLGALHAHRTWREGKGASFATWVNLHAKGHVLELFRQTDHLTRRLRDEARSDPENPLFERPAPLEAILAPADRDDPPDRYPRSLVAPDPAPSVLRSLSVREALARLPPREREMLWLYYVEGFSLREIGERFGVKEARSKEIKDTAVRRFLSEIGEEITPCIP